MGRARTLANTVKVSDALTIPSGNTAARPASAVAGTTRFNSQTGSIEYYDGNNWISTNLIPTVDSVTGTIYAGAASNLTIAVSNGTDTVTVRFSEGGSTIADVTGVTLTSGSGTVAVPAAVYGQTAGDTIAVSVINSDGTPSGNAINKTVAALPTGGTITTSGGFRIHTFTSSGTLTVPSGFSATAEYLLVAGGGGGGGSYYSGGGGAGGLLSGSTAISQNSYTITVGGGGAGGTQPVGASNGSNSSALGITTIGGGGGGDGFDVSVNQSRNGRSGGSGGGGNGSNNTNAFVGGSGTSGQGNAGGNTASSWNAGGGGGAGAAGGNGRSDGISNGGAGIQSSISGSAQFYAAGGSGFQFSGGSSSFTTRASNIGGASGRTESVTQNLTLVDAIINTGSGGGGADQRQGSYTRAGNGSSGIVIVRYQL